MKKILPVLGFLTLGLSLVEANQYAVYSKTVSGAETNSFSATITRIPPTFSKKTVTSTYFVVRNLTTQKELYVQTYSIGREKLFNLPQTSIGDFNTVTYLAMPTVDKLRILNSSNKRVFELSRSTDGTTNNYILDQRRPIAKRDEVRSYTQLSPSSVTLNINNLGSLQGEAKAVFLPKTQANVTVPPSLTGSGMNWEIFNGVDTPAIVTDFQASDIYVYPFSDRMTLNVALSDACTSGTPVAVGGSVTLNPGTDAFAAYQITQYLEKRGYSQGN
jgi:hypothetical protein